jgi:hypothetical protein
VADPPWLLRGEGLLAWASRPRGYPPSLPPGLSPVPGPAAIVAMSYDDSPVGPYLELSVVVPARLGLRPGLSVVAMAVSSPEARIAVRRAWGLPADVAALRWEADGAEQVMAWPDRGLVLRGTRHRPGVAAVLPVRSLQWRDAAPVVLPRRLRARVSPARCEIEVADADDPVAWAAGAHRGLAMQGARMVAAAARRPAGVVSSVPWRERVVPSPAEPAGGAATMTGPRAYGSVG